MTSPFVTRVSPHAGWDINDVVEAVLMIPLSTVVTGYHPLTMTFRQTTGAVHLDYFRLFSFLGNLSLPCWKMSKDLIFQASSKVLSHTFTVRVVRLLL